MPKPSNAKLIIFFKGIVVQKIYDHLKGTEDEMTKDEIDKDIKINAEFPYKSTADPKASSEDLQNLIIWGFVYGDECGVFIDYPTDKEDDQIKFNSKLWNTNKTRAPT